VGVGQNEIDIANLVDILVILLGPSSGDELQGIKRGVLEVSDIIAINRTDTDSALVNATMLEYKNANRIISYDKNFWRRKVIKLSALNGQNLDTLIDGIESFIEQSKKHNFFETNRVEQESKRLYDILKEEMVKRALKDVAFKEKYERVLERVRNNQSTAIRGVMELLDK
jgi:LAO/AO transport system kinase